MKEQAEVFCPKCEQPVHVFPDGSAICEPCGVAWSSTADLPTRGNLASTAPDVPAQTRSDLPAQLDVEQIIEKPISEMSDNELAAVKQRLTEDAQLREVAGEGAAEAAKKLRAVVAELQALDRLAYEMRRAELAKEYGIRPTTLDSMYNVEHPTKEGRRKKTIIEQAADVMLCRTRLYTAQNVALASVRVKDHVEAVHVNSGAFRIILRNAAREALSRTISEAQVSEVIAEVESRAFDTGTAVRAFNRIGRNAAGHILIDPGWPAHELIEVSADGWQIVPSAQPDEEGPPPLHEEVFTRAAGYLPFPHPEKGKGSLADLRRFINCIKRDGEEDGDKYDERFLLVLVFLVHCFFVEGPFTILVLMSESGSGKTTITKVLARLVDPHAVKSMSPPAEPRDMFAASAACWLLRYDNISTMPQWLSDLFCRFSTGGGTIERELYTNGEPYIFEAKRPSIVNGIADIFHQGDALQRSLILSPPVFRPQDRRTEDDLWSDFEGVAPGIFADVLDLLVQVLRRLPSITLDEPLRMADFCRIGMAVEEATYSTAARPFMDVYRDNQRLGNRSTVEASAIGPSLVKFIDEAPGGRWEGLVSELHAALTGPSSEGKGKFWPPNARSMSMHLRRLAPNLRGLGYTVHFQEQGDGMHVAIAKAEDSSPASIQETLDFQAAAEEEDPDVDFIDG